ncbi:hypothetical protein VPH35_116946 [Triticum aestivum]
MPKILRCYLDDSMRLVPHGAAGSTVTLSLPPLMTENYTVWAIKAEAIFYASSLWEAVSPTDVAAVDGKKDRTAKAQLFDALSEDLLMQVSSKKMAKEVWDSLKTRFVGADRVKAARLSTLCGEFDKLRMEEGESLDVYAGKIGGMAARYAGLGSTLGDAAMVKKLLDTVPDRLYSAVAGIEQFCDMETMAFEEALSRLKAFDERLRRHTQDGGEQSGGELLLTEAEWHARTKVKSSGKKGRCYNCGIHEHFRWECTKPWKEEALLANADAEPGLL